MNLRMKYNTKMKKKLTKTQSIHKKNMDKYLGIPNLIS